MNAISRITAAACLSVGSLVAIAVPVANSGANPVVTGHPGMGYLWNFDTTNNTDRDCQGFEVQIEGASTTDVLGTYWGTYNQPTVTAATVNGVPGIDVVWSAAYDTNLASWSASTPVGGLEHFGVSLGAAPGTQYYTWLCDNPSNPGHLDMYGGTTAGNGYPMPSDPSLVMSAGLSVPTSPSAPVVEVAKQTLVNNNPPAPGYTNGDAFWACHFELTGSQSVTLGDLLTDSTLIKSTLGQHQINDQCDLINGGGSFTMQESPKSGDKGANAAVYVFAYTGPYDDAHTPLCNETTGDPNNCANFLGQSITTDMIAQNLANNGARSGLGVTVKGHGSVSGNDPGNDNPNPAPIDCASGRCGEVVDTGTVLTLTASAAPGYQFTGWTGACAGNTTTCTVTMSAAKNVTASFIAPITLVSPRTSLAKGVSRTVTISGSNFVAPVTLKASGTGLTLSNIVVTSSAITVTVAAGTAAALGARNMTVTNGDGQIATCTSCVIVDALPTVKSLSIKTVKHGNAVTTILTGTGFTAASSVSFSGTGLTVIATYVSPTSMRIRVTAASTAARTARKITISNPDGGLVTATGITVQ